MSSYEITLNRWRELLAWLFEASHGGDTDLSQLAINVVTSQGRLRRATTCYLSQVYQRGQIVGRLYKNFGEDEFSGIPADLGLAGRPINEVEKFLIALGVSATPRFETFSYCDNYVKFLKAFVDRLQLSTDYP